MFLYSLKQNIVYLVVYFCHQLTTAVHSFMPFKTILCSYSGCGYPGHICSTGMWSSATDLITLVNTFLGKQDMFTNLTSLLDEVNEANKQEDDLNLTAAFTDLTAMLDEIDETNKQEDDLDLMVAWLIEFNEANKQTAIIDLMVLLGKVDVTNKQEDGLDLKAVLLVEFNRANKQVDDCLVVTDVIQVLFVKSIKLFLVIFWNQTQFNYFVLDIKQ